MDFSGTENTDNDVELKNMGFKVAYRTTKFSNTSGE